MPILHTPDDVLRAVARPDRIHTRKGDQFESERAYVVRADGMIAFCPHSDPLLVQGEFRKLQDAWDAFHFPQFTDRPWFERDRLIRATLRWLGAYRP